MAEGKIQVETIDQQIISVDVDLAKQWGPIRSIAELLGGLESQTDPIKLKDINAETLNKVIQWAEHHRNDPQTTTQGPDQKIKLTQIPEWDVTFLGNDPTVLCQLILAADYLDLQLLVEMVARTIALMIKDKTPEEVRQTFHIENDLPPRPVIT